MGCPPKIGVPPNHPMVNRVFHYKPSILGYPYFWKHPNLHWWIVKSKIRVDSWKDHHSHESWSSWSSSFSTSVTLCESPVNMPTDMSACNLPFQQTNCMQPSIVPDKKNLSSQETAIIVSGANVRVAKCCVRHKPVILTWIRMELVPEGLSAPDHFLCNVEGFRAYMKWSSCRYKETFEKDDLQHY